MIASGKQLRWSNLNCLFILAVAAGIGSGVAAAADCKLSVQASPQVLYSGQSTKVNVLAHFPSPPAPNGAYAFASSTFDIYASDPMWKSASAGAIVGNDVLGASASQTHWPQLGIIADPSNPFRVWSGVFKPLSNAPAMIEIEAVPTDFSVYPSKLTSSSVVQDAEAGSDFVLMNPLRVGRWLAAPGEGTSIQISDDVIVDGRIITGENWDSASVGTIWTGSVLLDSSTTIGFDRDPSSFKATVQILGAPRSGVSNNRGHLITGVDEIELDVQRSRVGSLTVTFDSAVNQGGHIGGANFCMADGSVRGVRYDAFIGGVFVASGDFNDDGSDQAPALIVSSLPQTVGHSTGALHNVAGTNTYRGLTTILSYDAPTVAMVRDGNGGQRVVTVDRIELRGIREAAARMSSSNNLKQLSLGCHVFEAHGVQEMRVTPVQCD